MSDFYKKILDNNKKWVESVLEKEPDYFTDLAKGQKPPLLWIGCSDSRVPANEIIGAKPGEVFVHRNIANMVIHSDMNMLSVLDYAVNVLRVKHVLVCGHYGCGGVKAAMLNDSFGIIDNWIRHIKDIYRFHQDELDAIEDETERFNRFVEIDPKIVPGVMKIDFSYNILSINASADVIPAGNFAQTNNPTPSL